MSGCTCPSFWTCYRAVSYGRLISSRVTRDLVCDAMPMAISDRTDIDGVIMHTGCGSQYCSEAVSGGDSESEQYPVQHEQKM